MDIKKETIKFKKFKKRKWTELTGNVNLFSEQAKKNCFCLFDDDTVCRFDDNHPYAILTHFEIV